MSRWLLTITCLLSLVVCATAQLDDLDALLAGLGDPPPPAETAAPIEDPFADIPGSTEEAVEETYDDLFGVFDDEPAAMDEAAEADLPPPAEPAELDSYDDLFADENWDETPAEVDVSDPFADIPDAPAPLEEDLFETDFDDLMAVPEDVVEPMDEMVEEVEEAVEEMEDDPLADLLGDEMGGETFSEEEWIEVTAPEDDLFEEALGQEDAESTPETESTPEMVSPKGPREPRIKPAVADKAPDWSEPVFW